MINTPLSLQLLIKPFQLAEGCSSKRRDRLVSVAAKFLPPLLLSFLSPFPALPLSLGDAACASRELSVGI